MMTIDLSSYDANELKNLKQTIEREIIIRQQQEVQAAREKILAIAQEAGMSIEELLGSTSNQSIKATTQKVKPRYLNPADSSKTWTGRGRQPKWISEGLAQGKTIDEFRI